MFGINCQEIYTGGTRSRKIHPLSEQLDRRAQAEYLQLGCIKPSHEIADYSAEADKCKVGRRSER